MATATDRAALERAIRAFAASVISDPDQDQINKIVRLVTAEIIDPMATLRQVEAEHGRRNAASIAAKLLVDRHDPIAVENMAQNLRRRRRKAEKRTRCSVHALAAE